MELLCQVLDSNLSTAGPIGNAATSNMSTDADDNQSGHTNLTLQDANLDPWNFIDWNKHVIVPTLCVLGIIGNVLNLVILGKRTREGEHVTYSLNVFTEFSKNRYSNLLPLVKKTKMIPHRGSSN